MRYLLLAVSFLFLAGCANESTVNTTVSNVNTNTTVTSAEPVMTTSASGNLIQTQEVTYYGNVKGYLAYNPALSSLRPAVIVVHEWWGLNDNMREIAMKLADEGYVALAVDLYDGKLATTQDEARTYSSAARANPAEAMKNLDAGISYLKTLQNVNKDLIGAIGYCFGGTWSYELARQTKDLKASVMYYGQFKPEDPFTNADTAVLGHFGEADTSIPLANVEKLKSTLAGVSAQDVIYTYPGAGHAFANKGSANYKEEPAQLAWGRTLAFLRDHLK
ncbi:MAG: dienelactone hydrolase family protein [Candidatus Gracilibacteria bacterium]